MRRSLHSIVLAAVGSCLAGISASGEEPGCTMSPAQFWTRDWGVGNWRIVAGDADADGRSDLLAIQDGDAAMELARTSALGKIVHPSRPRDPLGRHPAAAALGRFTRPDSPELLVVLDDGTIHVCSGLKSSNLNFAQDQVAGRLEERDRPGNSGIALASDLDGDGRTDVLIHGASGDLLVLRNAIAGPGGPRFAPSRIDGVPGRCGPGWGWPVRRPRWRLARLDRRRASGLSGAAAIR